MSLEQWFNFLIGPDSDCVTDLPDSGLDRTNEFLADLLDRRGPATGGGNPNRWCELYGGIVVETTAYEPDPATYRGRYYYNASRNVLYKKVIVQQSPNIVAHWRQVS